MKYQYLLRFSGEITIKAPKTRKQFIRQIKTHLKSALKIYRNNSENRFSFQVNSYFDRIEVFSEEPVIEVLKNIFGIQKIGIARLTSFFSYEDLLEKAEDFFKDKVAGKKFAVRTRSKNKTISTRQVNIDLGNRLFPYGNGVDLSNPEFTASLFILPENKVWFVEEFVEGAGGFPIGNEGETYMLFSGGIDSPVATFLMLRKGIKSHFLYYDLGSEKQMEHALKQALFLTRKYVLNYQPHFIIFDFKPVVAELLKLKPSFQNLALKYTFYKTAELFSRENPLPITTGESLAQVSTQTFSNLNTLSQTTERSIFRPLLVWTKEEITNLAKKIGTYPLAYTGKELCALSTKNVKTRSDISQLLEILEDFPTEILRKIIETRKEIKLSPLTSYEEIISQNQEKEDFSEFLPVFIDMEIEGELNFSFENAWNKLLQLPKNKNYYLICETGNKSGILANLMKEAKFKVRALSYEQFRELQNRRK